MSDVNKPAAAGETVRKWTPMKIGNDMRMVECAAGPDEAVYYAASDYAALAARVEVLERNAGAMLHWKEQAQRDYKARVRAEAQRDALQRECESLRKDAGRYRWVRANVVGASVIDYPHVTVQFPAGVRLWVGKDRFDESVDAAMSAAGGEVKP